MLAKIVSNDGEGGFEISEVTVEKMIIFEGNFCFFYITTDDYFVLSDFVTGQRVAIGKTIKETIRSACSRFRNCPDAFEKAKKFCRENKIKFPVNELLIIKNGKNVTKQAFKK